MPPETIGEWLAEVGLPQYTRVFAGNDIDLVVLRDLTEQDFEKLGVSMGHRKKLLKAISELDHRAITAPPPAVPRNTLRHISLSASSPRGAQWRASANR
jgi:hypothetical protein